MSELQVKYWKKNKPNGTRKFNLHRSNLTYEKVLFDYTLSFLCERSYFHNYEWFMLNEHVFIKRIKANSLICEYEVSLFDLSNRSNLLETYKVEIECLENDNTVDLFFQEYELKSPQTFEFKKEKLLTEWYRNETRATRNFLLYLQEFGDLKELKKSEYLSKATYHRNLKICIEKGYIKDGKLTKRLFVSKTVK